MQVEAFSGLLDKYQDYDLSPASEDAGRIRERFDQPWTTYFFISAEGKDVADRNAFESRFNQALNPTVLRYSETSQYLP